MTSVELQETLKRLRAPTDGEKMALAERLVERYRNMTAQYRQGFVSQQNIQPHYDHLDNIMYALCAHLLISESVGSNAFVCELLLSSWLKSPEFSPHQYFL